jgi:hypothetical protein
MSHERLPPSWETTARRFHFSREAALPPARLAPPVSTPICPNRPWLTAAIAVDPRVLAGAPASLTRAAALAALAADTSSQSREVGIYLVAAPWGTPTAGAIGAETACVGTLAGGAPVALRAPRTGVAPVACAVVCAIAWWSRSVRASTPSGERSRRSKGRAGPGQGHARRDPPPGSSFEKSPPIEHVRHSPDKPLTHTGPPSIRRRASRP